jgi:hypothetical protein
VELLGTLGLADAIDYVLKEACHAACRQQPLRKHCVRFDDRRTFFVKLKDWEFQLASTSWRNFGGRSTDERLSSSQGKFG